MNKYQQLNRDKYERFVFTLNCCGKFIMDSTDEVIETYIFEDFDVGVRGDLCDENLELFMEEGWIDEEIENSCVKLRNLFCDLQTKQPQIWNVQSVRTSKVWHEIIKLSDEIKSMLYL